MCLARFLKLCTELLSSQIQHDYKVINFMYICYERIILKSYYYVAVLKDKILVRVPKIRKLNR